MKPTPEQLKEIIQRLKLDAAEQSGTSPSFHENLQAYMAFVEKFAEDVRFFGKSFPNACAKRTGWELEAAAKLLIP